MFLTDQRVYFYSKFNRKTIIGKSTKIALNYSQIKDVIKESNFLTLPNMIRISMKRANQEQDPRARPDELKTEYLFTSFIHRDDCYELIKSQI